MLLYGFLATETARTLLVIAVSGSIGVAEYAICLVEIALCGGVLYAVRTGRRVRLILVYLGFTLLYALLTNIVLIVLMPPRPVGLKLDEKYVWVTAEDASEWEKGGGKDWRELASKGMLDIGPTLFIHPLHTVQPLARSCAE